MKMQGAKRRGEPPTIDMSDLKPIRNTTRSMLLEWIIDRFIRKRIMQGGMVE